jgi:valyl-tRNA synthetase
MENNNTTYNPISIEQKWQTKWQEQNIATPTFNQDKNFCIQLPPPNVTGILHMGHAFNQTIMDAFVRYYRMQGHNTLWVAGKDHAGIATQIVVERQLEEQNIKRKDLTRAEFISKIWEWKDKSGNAITEQMKRIGSSISWEHEYFTMDENMSRCVIEAFVKLHNDGLIYRGKRLVNWDPKLQSAVSDLEVSNTEEQGHMWYIDYILVNDNENNDIKITVATTRPETMFGDVALMVNPNDERYSHLIGQYVKIPISNKHIPIIADDYVDISFGTGAVKITPAHDFNDYAVAIRHNLPLISIFTLNAKYNDSECIPQDTELGLVGLDRYAARKRVLELLKENNLLVKEQKHTLMIPRCERTGEAIEPMLTSQWFVDLTKKGMDAITLPALQAVQNKEIEIVPDQWKQTYEHWLNNIQDWCISRQLWWGHQIPAWHGNDGEIFVARNLQDAQKIAHAKGYDEVYIAGLKQDEDVLDTWFSSALVPFSSLGWTGDDALDDNNQLMQHFLPSNVLVTGYDIIFFWVARMVMMTRYFTGKNPFNAVYVHGLVRDAEGKKMSKSEGNTLDPVDLIDGIDLEKLLQKRTTGLRKPETAPQVIKKTSQTFPEGIPAFGADALRFTFASLASLGRSINFDDKRCGGYRNFCNKLWNATRFVLMNLEGYGKLNISTNNNTNLTFADLWMLNKLQQAQTEIAGHFATYRMDLAANALYQIVWDDYCDWYLELAKVQLNKFNSDIAYNTRYILVYILESLLRMLHPIIPFITAELWEKLSGFIGKDIAKETLALQSYPNMVELLNTTNTANNIDIENMSLMQDIINGCRTLRSEMNVSPSSKIALDVVINEQNEITSEHNLNNIMNYVQMLAKVSEFKIQSELEKSSLPSIILPLVTIRFNIPIDIEAETARLNKDLERLSLEINKCELKLNNPDFVDKAPKSVVEQEQKRLMEFTASYEQFKSQLANL